MQPTRTIRAALTLTVALILTGCAGAYLGGPVPHPGIDRPFDGLSTKTKPQLLDEIIQQTHDIAQLIGGQWMDSGDPPSVFDLNDRDGWPWKSCDHAAATGQYSVFVVQRANSATNGFDPESVTGKVRSYWEGLGFTIRQIGPPAQDGTRGRSINVDLPHSAGLQFFASTEAMSIWVDSECVKWE